MTLLRERGARDRPSIRLVLRMMYWTVRRDWRLTPDLLAILGGSIRKYVGLRFWRKFRDRRLILILALTEHMGDIVAAEPLSRHARAAFPSARIYWVTQAPYRDVVANYPAIDDIIVVRCLTEWLLFWGLGAADIVWDLHLSERECRVCNVSYRKPGLAGAITDATYYDFGSLLAGQCISAGIEPISDAPRLTPPDAAVTRVDQLRLPGRFLVIHCRANDACRDWPLERWKDLVEYLTGALGIQTIEIGLKAHAIAADGPLSRSLCGVLSIMETAELIRRADLFIGIDSGPAHIANAVGTPGIILAGHYRRFRRYMSRTVGFMRRNGARRWYGRTARSRRWPSNRWSVRYGNESANPIPGSAREPSKATSKSDNRQMDEARKTNDIRE